MAFDDNRDGFFMAFGLGVHSLDNDFIYAGTELKSNSNSGLATSFKIGFGVTEQIALYYIRNASWYNDSYYDGYSATDTVYTVGINGLGMTYYFSSSSPSFYMMLATGIGDMFTPLETDPAYDSGSANLYGIGYEFSNHFTSELTLLKVDIESSEDNQLSLESSSLQFTINYLFY